MNTNNTSIFYVNSLGFMAQWKGQVLSHDESSISIRFSKNKSLKYNLKDLDIDFMLITKTPVKSLGVSVTENSTSISFDDRLKEFVKQKTIGNVSMIWENGKWN